MSSFFKMYTKITKMEVTYWCIIQIIFPVNVGRIHFKVVYSDTWDNLK